MRVGSREWERAGGPPLTVLQRLSVLGGAAAGLIAHFTGELFARSVPRKIDLSAWAPPDSACAREAEAFMREVSTPQMANHSLRTYYFAGVMYELARAKPALDREALYVAALLHDVGFHEPRPPADRCFTIGSAREARRMTEAAGWDEARRDRVALAITTNPSPKVSLDEFGPEAHFMSIGGGVEVLGQRWRAHPDNIREILARAPRDGFPADGAAHIRREAKLNRGSRFACLSPLLPLMISRSRLD